MRRADDPDRPHQLPRRDARPRPIALHTKWWRHYLYFCATYFTPHPEAVPPTREVRFARLEYRDNKRFNLAYMRHTGEWVVVYENRSLTGCLRALRDEEIFQP